MHEVRLGSWSRWCLPREWAGLSYRRRWLFLKMSWAEESVSVNKPFDKSSNDTGTRSPKYCDPRTGKTWCGRGRRGSKLRYTCEGERIMRDNVAPFSTPRRHESIRLRCPHKTGYQRTQDDGRSGFGGRRTRQRPDRPARRWPPPPPPAESTDPSRRAGGPCRPTACPP